MIYKSNHYATEVYKINVHKNRDWQNLDVDESQEFIGYFFLV